MGPAFYPVPFRPGHPVLDLKDNTLDDVDYESGKQENLHYLDQWIGGHEHDSLLENDFMVLGQRQYEQVDPQVDDQKEHQEDARDRHNDFLGQG
jgi:hypothetical protein